MKSVVDDDSSSEAEVGKNSSGSEAPEPLDKWDKPGALSQLIMLQRESTSLEKNARDAKPGSLVLDPFEKEIQNKYPNPSSKSDNFPDVQLSPMQKKLSKKLH